VILRDSDRYFTPRWIVDLVIEQFGGIIDCDPCSDPLSDIPATHRFDAREGVDGLVKSWVGKCWVNPPYSDAQPWVLRAVQHAASGGEVIMLINASTDTSYWTSYVFEHGTVAFVNKRVKFTKPGSDKAVANLCPSAIVYFGPNVDAFIRTWQAHATIVTKIKEAA
jgi:hypothetical protein